MEVENIELKVSKGYIQTNNSLIYEDNEKIAFYFISVPANLTLSDGISYKSVNISKEVINTFKKVIDEKERDNLTFLIPIAQ